MSKSLFLKIFTGFVIVIVAMAGFTLLLSYRTVRNHHLKVQRESLILMAEGMKPVFSDALAAHDSARLDSLAKHLGARTNSRITIVGPDGTVIGDSWRNPAEMENHRTRPEIMRALRGDIGTSLRYSDTLEEDLIYAAIPIGNEGRVDGVLRVSLRLRNIDQALADLRNDIAMIGMAVAILSLMGALLFARNLSRPIDQLTEASRRVASGDFDTRVLLRGGGELKDLADSFNSMTDQVKILFGELSEKSDELNGIVGSIQDGLLVLDRDGRIVLSNPGFTSIAGREGSRGMPYWEVIRAPDLDDLVRTITAQRTGLVREIQLGGRIYLCSGSFLASRGGVVLLIHDITEMKNVEKVKRDFIVNLSHELRTPLTAIKGFLETLQEEVTLDGKHYLGIASKHTDRLASIVEDLLVLSELEDSGTGLVLEPVDLRELVRETVHILEPGAREKKIHISIEGPGSGPRIEGDRFKLEQVFINLIDNALKYTEKGDVRVKIRETEDHVVITVEDTGAGIPAEHLPRIFERFYVVDKSRSKTFGGTGLGLAIVKHIVLMHGGTIEVESTPGMGTRFTLTLPAAQAS